MTKRNIQYQQYISELQNKNLNDIVLRLRKTRADMLGTNDEDHYWDCHEAADTIEDLRQSQKSPLTGDEVEAILLCKQVAEEQQNHWIIDQLNEILKKYI